jgi:hypothetical protein
MISTMSIATSVAQMTSKTRLRYHGVGGGGSGSADWEYSGYASKPDGT